MFVKLSETSGEELGRLNKRDVGVLLLLVGSLSVSRVVKGEYIFPAHCCGRVQHGGNDSSVGNKSVIFLMNLEHKKGENLITTQWIKVNLKKKEKLKHENMSTYR